MVPTDIILLAHVICPNLFIEVAQIENVFISALQAPQSGLSLPVAVMKLKSTT